MNPLIISGFLLMTLIQLRDHHVHHASDARREFDAGSALTTLADANASQISPDGAPLTLC